MTQEEFRKLQLTQLEIMDEIHRICVLNNIEYYIIGGTALGAVRHGGFIPWDLDIDIAMKRKDYDNFKAVCATALNPRYIYRDYTNTHDFDHPHALVCINNTVLVNKFDKFNPKTENLGIYLDIFPLDNAPVNERDKKKQIAELARIKKLKYLKVGMCYQKSFIKKAVKKTISALIFWTTTDKLNKKLDECMRQYNNENTGYLCSMSSHYSYEKQYMPSDVYGSAQLVDYEGRKYYAPQKLHEYLTKIYKDYMKLPPIEEQQMNLGVFEEVVFDK